jgi:hypothetical protein
MEIVQKSNNQNLHDILVFCGDVLLAKIKTEDEDVIQVAYARFRV